jgi:hypothetical protein
LNPSEDYYLDVEITGSAVGQITIAAISPVGLQLTGTDQLVEITVSLIEGQSYNVGSLSLQFLFTAVEGIYTSQITNEPEQNQGFLLIDFEEYTSTNSYLGLVDFQDGLKIQFGNTVSTGAPIHGLMHALLRVAQNTQNVAFLQYGGTNFDIEKISFQSKITATTNSVVEVSFSDDGEVWGTPLLVTGITSLYSTEPFEVESNVPGARYFKISVSFSNVLTSTHRDLFLDDIKIFE